VVFRHARRDIFDAVGVGHRRAAVFLNDQCHTKWAQRLAGAAAFEKQGIGRINLRMLLN
jgi:hypothetical protein